MVLRWWVFGTGLLFVPTLAYYSRFRKYFDALLFNKPIVPGQNYGASPLGCNLPLRDWFFEHYSAASAGDILDVGGAGFALFRYLTEDLTGTEHGGRGAGVPLQSLANWECIDVFASHGCREYSGESLEYAANSKDIVLFNFCLHHAAGNTLRLLRDAKRVARKYVIINEDMQAQNFEQYRAQTWHDWKGTFRSLTEWKQIFEILGLELEVEGDPGATCAGKDTHSVERRLFVLKVGK
eukprot:gnl/TRDRNA2_/TRDRNA2_202166_c0_seq1.p1 gnl/TRDRNA2_/TRDRNA2_202166_c0~~gnl/TRDRNA2_/TRDRNA2_202166_c0_seq1.p1  ORF type:complete len:238 (-),score=32.74 gnl/TRDRNA2_/TRDRNA2_202166_c0_seq1:26-739(-)